MTTLPSGSLEYSATIDSVLWGCHRRESLPRVDNNPLNATRQNIQLTTTKRPNAIITSGSLGMLLINASTVLFDAEQSDIVASSRWYIANFRTHPTVVSRIPNDDGSKRKVQLPRLLMGVTNPLVSVKHRNLDRLDCRMCNLYVD